LTKPLTKDEREHLAKVKQLPCGLCQAAPPSIAHHIRTGQGMSQRGGHYCTIPLCPLCHSGKDGIHGTKALWRIYRQTELNVLDQTIQLLLSQ